MTVKPRDQRAWWLVTPVVLAVAFSAIIPLMTVVNYSVQDILSPERRVFVGWEWFRQILRDPELHDHFWVNPMGKSFKQMTVSDLLLVSHTGEVVEGSGLLNGAAFTIHSQIHMANPKITAAAHSHSVYGKAFSSLGKTLDPLTQDSCAFYDDHVLFDDFSGVVLDNTEGEKIAAALGDKKAAILQNHGLLTVGDSVDAAAWWYITMERSCQAQLMAEAAGTPKLIEHEVALHTRGTVGSPLAGWFSFQPLNDVILAEQPELLN